VLVTVLAAAAVAAAGCRASEDASPRPAAGPTGSSVSPPPHPLLAVLHAEHRLLAGYDATARVHPELATRLAPLRADHVEHVAALQAARTDPAGAPDGATPAGATPSGAGPESGAAGSAPAAPPVPNSAAAALAALRAAERAAAAAGASAAETAPAEHAALLASISACEASHQVLLAVGAGRPAPG
jgi:hypothetical protein